MFQFSKTLLVLCLTSALAFAQNALVAITCDKSSSATCTYTDARGEPQTSTIFDANGDGKIEFTVPAGTTTVTIGKMSDGRFITYNVKPTPTN